MLRVFNLFSSVLHMCLKLLAVIQGFSATNIYLVNFNCLSFNEYLVFITKTWHCLKKEKGEDCMKYND